MKIALLITTYNRPDLLKRCLDSLSRCDLGQLHRVIIVDDCSDDTDTRELIGSQKWPVPMFAYYTEASYGIKHSIRTGCSIAFDLSRCDLVINLDPDAIVKPNFINELVRLKAQYPEHIISGFNCDHPKNPVLVSNPDSVFRKHCNGINMLFDKQQYDTILHPALMGPGNWDYASTGRLPFVIAKPSLVQHIGVNRSTMGHQGGDTACDFKALMLDRVCLFGIDAVNPDGLTRAAEICERDIVFGAKHIITEKLFSGRDAYSRFMIESLHHHLPEGDYTHVLTIHPDGYIQNPGAWRDDWLEYDYIGASWWYKDSMNVGNGGFSLRSRRLIHLCSQLDLKRYHPEDDVLCRELRPWLEKEYGIKFAPVEVADRFSIEAYSVPAPHNRYSGQFGFHGYYTTGLPMPPPRRGILPRKSIPTKR